MKYLKQYHLPNENHEGWATIILDSEGFFAAVSDFGNYAFYWSNSGCTDFRHFFLRAKPDYFLSKLSNQVLNAELTEQAIRKEILSLRRQRTITKEEAREEWCLLESMQHEDFEFSVWLYATQILEHTDPGYLAKYSYDPDAISFVTKTLPRLSILLAQELENEDAEISL